MKRIIFIAIYIAGSFSLKAQWAIKANTLYTVSGSPINNAVVLINKGKIEKVGKAESISIPEGYRVIEAKVVTPGLIDARTVIGMSGVLNIAVDQDQLEKSNPIQPELRAIDAYNPEE